MASLQTRVTYPRDGSIDRILSRLTGSTTSVNRTSALVRRIILRYQQMLDEAGEPDVNLIVTIGDAIVNNQITLLWGETYPSKADILKLLRDLPLPLVERDRLSTTVEQLPFAEYARLIEAIEHYHLK